MARSIVVALVLVTALAPVQALAQGTARSMDIDTSIRAAAMGGTSAAVGWGDPGVWGNPATIAMLQGVRWEHGRTQLVPGLADHVFLRSERLLIGGSGIGASFMGEPFENVGGTRLDYGTSTVTDPGGNPTGTFDSFERVQGVGIGVSVLRFIDAMSGVYGGRTNRSRAFDVSLGVQHKRAEVVLAPDVAGGRAAAQCIDWGTMVRLSPLEFGPATALGERFELDLTLARSVLNANDNAFTFLNEDIAVPATRMRRWGGALRVAMKAPWASTPNRDLRARLFSALTTIVEVGGAFDREHNSAGDAGYPYDVERNGWEVTALSVVSVRGGHVTDRLGEIIGGTSGYGIRVPVGPWAGFRFDHAVIPQSSGLEEVKREGWSTWIDPWAIARDLRERR